MVKTSRRELECHMTSRLRMPGRLMNECLQLLGRMVTPVEKVSVLVK